METTNAVLLDTTGCSAARFEGESLLARHVRQAAGAGVRHAVVVLGGPSPVHLSASLSRRVALKVVVLPGVGLDDAVKAGLRRLRGTQGSFAADIRNIVPNDCYARLAGEDTSSRIRVTTCPALVRYDGSPLRFWPGTGSVRHIAVQQADGCPPGHLPDIWVHHLRGAGTIRAVSTLLSGGRGYEAAINSLIARGERVTALRVTDWEQWPAPLTHST